LNVATLLSPRRREPVTLPLDAEVDLVGTLRYMSPEQAMGKSVLVDQRTDIYSLGVTLYELLALHPAFSGDDGPALLRQIEQDEPRPLRQLQPKNVFGKSHFPCGGQFGRLEMA
jgi:serine/threonine protein kinase